MAGQFGLIAQDLDEVDRILRATTAAPRRGAQPILNHVSAYQGKQLRPTLLLLIARACNHVTPTHHLLAAVLEMIHTATLVHDDVLDGASVRRHASTINATWGNQASILLGDFLFTHAFHLTSTLGDARACRIIAESTNRLCEGEMRQVCRRGDLDLGEAEYLEIIDAKTAELTACACRLGALYAGLDEDRVAPLTTFGRSLGLAFQITDDLLDLTGEETQAGKSLGSDLDQQKLTMPVIYLLQAAAPADRARGRAILMASGNHKRQALLPVLRDAGAIEYAKRRAETFASSALAHLACLPASPARAALEALTGHVVCRDR